MRQLYGDDRPKQYAGLTGSRSLLRQTLDRGALLRPGLATVMPDAAPNDSVLRRAFERLEQAMDDWCAEARLAA